MAALSFGWRIRHGSFSIEPNKEEAKYYLDIRKTQGFNVIQAVALAEIDGLNDPNQYGEKPFDSLKPMKFNEKYWNYVDEVISLAEEKGIHIALLPTWGDKVFKNTWGVGTGNFSNAENAFEFRGMDWGAIC
jgi:hypothetical protein